MDTWPPDADPMPAALPEPEDAVRELLGLRLIAALDDVTIVVTPRRWRLWTPGALARLAHEHGLSASGLAGWFHPWD